MRNDTAENVEQLLVTIKQARTMLGGLGHSTIYRYLDAGTLKAVKIGGRRLIRRDSIIELIERSAA